MTKSFWNIPDLKNVRAPVTILKEQGSALSEATKGLLFGTVSTVTGADTMYLTMDIMVPALNNYIYNILEYTHPILYSYPGNLTPRSSRNTIKIKDEEHFLKELESILSSDSSKKILEGLMLQATSARK